VIRNVIARYQLILLGVTAAILYNDWPLGYWLNYPVAKVGLISDLEATHQPFNFLFIATDVMSSLITVIMILKIIRLPYRQTRPYSLMVGGLSIFAVGTALSALVPLNCTASIARCGLQTNQILSIHNDISSGAALGIVLSLIGCGLLYHERLDPKGYIVVLIGSGLWAISGITFVVRSLNNLSSQIEQQLFVLLTGVAVVIIAVACFSAVPDKRKLET
jgi:hypothetical protein